MAAGLVENVTAQQAVEKLRSLAKGNTCHFGTYPGPNQLTTRPMYTQDVDDAGTLWFMAQAVTDKMAELAANPTVKLLYADAGTDAYLAVDGTAEIVLDKAKIEQYWSVWVKTWVPGGKDDPSLRLIAVRPTSSYYWDTQHGKMVGMLKIGISTITGAQMDDGREGTIAV